MSQVYFATNRKFTAATDPITYGSECAPSLQYGTAIVDQIDIRAPSSGTIENIVAGTPDILKALENSTNDVLVFVHGTANDFTDSITRAAYNQTWLENSGLAGSTFDVICLSWPARHFFFANLVGDYLDYRADQRAASQSGELAAQFLAQIKQLRSNLKTQPGQRQRRVNLLCHSMGNYMLGFALPEYGKIAPAGADPLIFDEIVLAAADEISGTFHGNIADPVSGATTDRLMHLKDIGREITVYFSRDDLAMDLSHVVNHNYRLGYNGPADASNQAFYSPDIYEFVDCTGVSDYISSPFTAPDRTHQYYRQSPTVRKDIVMSLTGATPTRPKYDPAGNVYKLFP